MPQNTKGHIMNQTPDTIKITQSAQEIWIPVPIETTELKAEIERLRADLRDWAECASVDVTMEGPRLMGWNPIALNRCFTKYEAALQPKEEK